MAYPIPTPHRQWHFLLMALFFIALTIPSVRAAEPIGDILFVHGTVEIIDTQGKTRLAEKGGQVFEGDRIISKDASSLQILMSDKGYFAVRPNSEITLDQYQFKDTDTDKVQTSIIRGGLRSITGAIGQKNKKAFQLRTPVATIGIRGTDLTAFYISQQMASPALGEQGSYLAIKSGGGILQNSAGTQLLAPGQAAYSASANLAPSAISELPGIFRLPTFEEIIPGVNDEEEAKEEEEKEEEKEEEEKEEEDNSDDKDTFEFRAHAYMSAGSADTFMHNYDLADMDAATSYVPMVLTKNTPYESSGSLKNFAAGAGLTYRPVSFVELYADAEIKTTAIDTDLNVENTDTNTDISGGKIKLGGAFVISDVLKAWVEFQHAGYDSGNDNFYDGYDLYNRNDGYSNYYAANYDGLKLAAAPGYEGDRFQLGATLDLGQLVGVFGTATFTQNKWDSYYTNHYYDGSNYRYELNHTRSGIYMDVLEAGARFNPILIPIDFYASTLIGSFGSEGDDYYNHFNGNFTGLRGKAVFNNKGIISAYGTLTYLELSGDGGGSWYDTGLGYTTSRDYTIEGGLIHLAAGAEINIAQRFKLQALAQSINGSASDDTGGSLATEIRARVDL